MKITKISQQVKRADRYSIYVDGKYTFSLGEHDLLRLGIHSGQEITDDQLAEFQDSSALGKMFDKTLNLLSFRLRSEWELRDYLRRQKAEPEITNQILNRLSKNGYVNDEQFTRRWVENRRLLKPTSKRKLSMELRQKRIPTDIIDRVLSDDETSELEVLKQLVDKKQHRYPDKIKFMQYLARQGYNYDDIKRVLSGDFED